MKSLTQINQLLWLGLVLVITACASNSTNTMTPPTKINSTTPAGSEDLVTTTPLPMPTSTDIAIAQQTPENINWSTYVFDAGVSFEYPSHWIIMALSNEDSVEFFGFDYNVRVDVYNRPIKDKALADPHTWGPNEGGYEIRWEKPISIENANGLEFIWGRPNATQTSQVGGFLIAIYYSEQHELEVRLQTDADTIPTDANRFSIFEHMVQSVRITP